jgi:hypothetical protein
MYLRHKHHVSGSNSLDEDVLPRHVVDRPRLRELNLYYPLILVCCCYDLPGKKEKISIRKKNVNPLSADGSLYPVGLDIAKGSKGAPATRKWHFSSDLSYRRYSRRCTGGTTSKNYDHGKALQKKVRILTVIRGACTATNSTS